MANNQSIFASDLVGITLIVRWRDAGHVRGVNRNIEKENRNIDYRFIRRVHIYRYLIYIRLYTPEWIDRILEGKNENIWICIIRGENAPITLQTYI